MFSPTVSLIAVVFMGLLSVIGLGAALFLNRITSAARTSRRVATVSHGRAVPRTRVGAPKTEVAGQARRKQVQETLRQLEERQKASKKRLPLRLVIQQAGLTMSVRAFWLLSACVGVTAGGLIMLAGSSPLLALAAGFAGGLGLPRWILGVIRKRRQAAFLEEFANAIDIVVRGVRAGLPINDCIKIIAAEAGAPVGPEFAAVVESQKVGLPLDQALERMHERVPLPEVNFLVIVIAIQQRAGGNLSEALSNLSKVLRDRKKIKAKIQSMSQEAKSSAAIIAALPFGVMGIMVFTSPTYISLLWTTAFGQSMMVASAIWMLLGVLVMRKMINFNY